MPAWWLDAAGRIQVWANNKVPTRQAARRRAGVLEDQIVVNPCGHSGGDFEGKSPAMNVPRPISRPSARDDPSS